MTQTVIVTLIICLTIIAVSLIISLLKGKDDELQRRDDILKVVRQFKEDHVENETTLVASEKEVLSFINLIWRLL